MSFPGQKAQDPWRMSRAVDNAGFVQDIVIATTRLIHHAELTDRERASLERCRRLLRCAGEEVKSKETPGSDAPQLEPTGSASLRRATRAALHLESSTPEEAERVLDLALADDSLEEGDLAVIANLRDAFVSIGRANLESINASRNSEGETGLWQPLTASSPF